VPRLADAAVRRAAARRDTGKPEHSMSSLSNGYGRYVTKAGEDATDP
jgi:hypothetical protein